ncbi:MAG: PP2C family protein-serine/threonine phosphatase [Lachnospiraceae bacterium]|nr:PP2C family protein-serine/threonine phosphatase [Lachnospiraceae bacterium]
MSIDIVILWSIAGFLSFIFVAVSSIVTLKPAKQKAYLVTGWLFTAVVDFLAVFISYFFNLTVDITTALVQPLLACLALVYMYEDDIENKLFVSLMFSLLGSAASFMICGSLDSLLGAQLGYFSSNPDIGPYTVENILLYIVLKTLTLGILEVLYIIFLRKRIIRRMQEARGLLKKNLTAPIVNILCFYVINAITNQTGIFPSSPYFFPLYLTICIIIIVEYLQIFSSIRWTAEARRVEEEKQTIVAELNVAANIQADMLPGEFPAFPDRKEFDLYATMDPARNVGGDFYDFFLIDEDHIGLVIADVSGKGIPASLFMVIAKTLIKNRALLGGSPSEVLEYANEQLCEGNKEELFVTVWFAILQLSTGKGVVANAGHEHPALRRAGGDYELVIYNHAPAVAAMEGIRFREHEFELHPGDSLYVYTDGVPEATNIEEELFNTDRMLQSLNRNKDADQKTILEEMKKDMDAFVGEADQFDDITMLGFKYFGPGKE